MIEEKITSSGRLQIELKSTYKLQEKKAYTSYTIEFYIFLPNSLGINSETYPKYLFYRDIQTYIRVKTPAVLLRDVAVGPQCPMRILENSLQALAREQSEPNVKNYENQNKMFCSIFRGALRAHVNLILDPRDPTDTGPLMEQYLHDVSHIVREFRQCRGIINVPTVNETLFSTYEYSDEYVSLTIEQLSFELLEGLKKGGGKCWERWAPKLIQLIDSEVGYRQKRGYPSIVDPDSDNEEFVYRSSVLKSFNEGILLLNTRVRQEGKIVEKVVYRLAAGLAMIFATAVAFYSQARYGNLTMAFFVALVVSYMFKDRMKELVRMYLNKHVQRRFYDHKVTICGGAGRRSIGHSRESFSFVSEKALDPEIRKLRNPDRFGSIDNAYAGEQIILYRKNIKISSGEFGQIYQDHAVQGLNDITRLNVARFVRRMESPKRPLHVTDGDDYRKVRGSKVYHVNLVIKYTSHEGTSFARFRIVLNRRGVQRIEAVDPP